MPGAIDVDREITGEAGAGCQRGDHRGGADFASLADLRVVDAGRHQDDGKLRAFGSQCDEELTQVSSVGNLANLIRTGRAA